MGDGSMPASCVSVSASCMHASAAPAVEHAKAFHGQSPTREGKVMVWLGLASQLNAHWQSNPSTIKHPFRHQSGLDIIYAWPHAAFVAC